MQIRVLLFIIIWIFSPPIVVKSQSEIKAGDSTKVCIPNRSALHDTSIVDRRFQYENMEVGNPFAIVPRHPIYLMPVFYTNSPNNYEVGQTKFANSLNKVEVKFQISFKILVWKNILGDNLNFYLSYTQQSWWQAYNKRISSPFRETNYEPEAFFMLHTQQKIGHATLRLINVGMSHQSNGRDGIASRSWNRLFLQFVVDIHNRLVLEIHPWWRIPEGKKQAPEDPSGDDNPDIYAYLGYGHIKGTWMLRNNHTLTFLVRDNFRKNQRGALQVEWSFPLVRKIRGYFQFFTGYGESLIDYNYHSTRLGFGIELTNYL